MILITVGNAIHFAFRLPDGVTRALVAPANANHKKWQKIIRCLRMWQAFDKKSKRFFSV